ncbi:class I SAM-dependent methyltransferase [Vallicoccus soli]|uniref:Methyltransferase domain-containing protein n=1 Tax=Vallicoccus soli TaxID=2339232 RepID=A0A3A3YQZ9_9ACTN|nr:methyltransferase domain-containing protein [Vallicoccus soli]RJK92652.1 methyltransferase domain-containing protein [Vallicoccus soli]
MTLADVDALRSPAGRALLAALQGYDERAALALGERLRREHPAPLVAAAMTQARLRARAAPRLGPAAASMLLTPDGLEQATRAEVAARRARRFVDAGVRDVVDLCCGVGGDLLPLAAAGLDVLGVDRDPVACALAAANAEALGLAARARVLAADVTAVDVRAHGGAFCDPARRAGGRRVMAPEGWSPPWSWVEGVLAASPAAGAKVAPGVPRDLAPPGAEVEWVSVDGDVVEAAVWAGALASGVRHRATLLPSGATVTGSGAEEPPPVGPVRRFLYEPDGAVVRAGLVSAVVAAVDGSLLDPTIAYVAADGLVPTPLARPYEVLEALPFQLKRLRAALRARDVGTVVVKKRGSALEPEQLRRQLRLTGSGTATVVLTRVAGEPWALVARPA